MSEIASYSVWTYPSSTCDGSVQTGGCWRFRRTFLLQDLEALLGLGVQVLQVAGAVPLDEHVLRVVLGGPVVDRQPLLLLMPPGAGCGVGRRRRKGPVTQVTFCIRGGQDSSCVA